MPLKRLWFLTIAAAAFSAQHASRAQSVEEAAPTADFLILAIAPEGETDYKLVEIGDTKLDVGRLNAAIPQAAGSLLRRLGIGERDYDEAAETAQCRSACKANARCRDFAYTRPSEAQPVGVCRLKALVETSFGVMTPVKDAGDPIASPAGAKAPAPSAAAIVFEDKEPKGAGSYGGGAKPTPVTLKFQTPAAGVKIFIRAADATGQRTWAAVEAFDAKGKLVERAGAWISAGGEREFGRAVAIGGETDRIATVKIDAREPGALLLEGVEFSRTLIAPPPVPEIPAKTPLTPPQEEIPPPPKLPPLIAEQFPLPPRAVATEPPADITAPPVASEPPLAAPAPPKIAEPAAPLASAPRKRGLPLWLAIGAVAVMFAGAAVYWRNHRARTRARLTTCLVSSGLDRRTITLDGAEGAGMALRFIVRAPANTNTPATHIDLVPKGVPV